MNNVDRYKNAMKKIQYDENLKLKVYSYVYRKTSTRISRIFPRTIISLVGIQFVFCFLATNVVGCIVR